jgi:hypothetical protein
MRDSGEAQGRQHDERKKMGKQKRLAQVSHGIEAISIYFILRRYPPLDSNLSSFAAAQALTTVRAFSYLDTLSKVKLCNFYN